MDDDEVECVYIPKKLLETIYMDYILFDNMYMTDLEEEVMKMNDECCWQLSDNNYSKETINRIKFYLEQ